MIGDIKNKTKQTLQNPGSAETYGRQAKAEDKEMQEKAVPKRDAKINGWDGR